MPNRVRCDPNRVRLEGQSGPLVAEVYSPGGQIFITWVKGIIPKVNEEGVVNLANYAVNLHDQTEALKVSVSAISFFRNGDQNSESELLLLAGALSDLTSARDEAREVWDEVAQIRARVAGLAEEAGGEVAGLKVAGAEIVARLEGGAEEAASQLNAINQTVESLNEKASEADDARAKISELLEGSSEDRERLSEFVSEVESATNKIEALYSRADARYVQQNEYVQHVEELISQAKSMVSAATVAGLAQAFSEERKTLDKGMRWAMGWFVAGIVSIFFVTILLAAYVFEIPLKIGDIPLSGTGKTPELGDEITIAGVLSRAIILLAPFWLTLFSARRYRNLFDLRQQYSHKYNMAFSVNGFKQQAPSYEEEIAALVFHVLAESPITNTKRSGRAMDESPLMSLQELARLPADRFEAVLGALRGSKETRDA